MAVTEYQTSTSIESSAAIPSAGEYCEKPVRTAACFHSGREDPNSALVLPKKQALSWSTITVVVTGTWRSVQEL
jgi:hypothetical protein